MEEFNKTADAMVREVPFWRDDITAEEYDEEKRYFYECLAKDKIDEYEPLYVQRIKSKNIEQTANR